MGIQMPNSSRKKTKGNPARKATCLVYAAGPSMATKLEKKCSTKNAPMGIMPVSECRRRHRKEEPSPARNGATPPRSATGAAELALDATERSLRVQALEMNLSLFDDGGGKSRNLAPRAHLNLLF